MQLAPIESKRASRRDARQDRGPRALAGEVGSARGVAQGVGDARAARRDISTAVAGSMVADLEGSAAAYFSGWDIRKDMGGIIILTMAMTTANPTPRRPGTIADHPVANLP